ncbi:MAG: hypothetical protein MN733_36540 [Nitrososphaera sp.]|nr:hypothetical protein [Nitrososphaera sp.]
MEKGKIESVYIALPGKPKVEVLYLYLLINGIIHVRMNIAGYEDGYKAVCWDKSIMQPKAWAVCTGPVVRPRREIHMKGFQGFRYTEELW